MLKFLAAQKRPGASRCLLQDCSGPAFGRKFPTKCAAPSGLLVSPNRSPRSHAQRAPAARNRPARVKLGQSCPGRGQACTDLGEHARCQTSSTLEVSVSSWDHARSKPA
jgi:hypothetical protein